MSAVEKMLEESSVVSPLEQSGNYFIMDTDQLVVNPFEDLQKEALDKEKKSSLTERLTAVKNNVCENHLNIKTTKLQSEISNRLKKIHDHSSRLRYEYKLFDIYKRKNNLENKRRVQPAKDFSYDKKQISISEKRLGIMTDSFYLNKRQPFPLRGRNIHDFDSGPTINKARIMMKQQQAYNKEEEKSRAGLSTPGSLSMVSTSTHVPIWKRRDSKSAPPSAKPSSASKRRNPYEDVNEDDDDSHLPMIHGQKNRDTHVKFSIVDHDDQRTITPEMLPMHTTIRPSTYTGVVRRKESKAISAWGSDSEDDEIDIMQKINLRAIIFGSKDHQQHSETVSRSQTRESSRSVPAVMRRSQNKPLTQEMLLDEQKQIEERLNKFYATLGNKEDEEEEEEEPPPPPPEPKPTSKFPKVANVSRAGALMSAFAKPVDNSKRWKTEEELKKDEGKSAGDKDGNEADDSGRRQSVQHFQPEKIVKEKKNMWDFIKASMDDGTIERCKTPTKLVLQQMTKLNLENVKQTHIPLASAGRAMRHTPTFKMRKVVERLMASRTKFEQQEVDKLRSQMDGENAETKEDAETSG